MDDEGTSTTLVSSETSPYANKSFLSAQTSTSRQPREEKVSHTAQRSNFATIAEKLRYRSPLQQPLKKSACRSTRPEYGT